MSRLYFEKFETLPEEEVERTPQIIRIEVQSEAEALQLAEQYKDILPNEKAYLHSRNHFADARLNRPCTRKELKG